MIRALPPIRCFAALVLGVAAAWATSCPAAPEFSAAARRTDFTFFIAQFTENYAYLDRAEKPWESWSTRFAAAVERADSPEAFAAVLASALDELHDFHAEVRSRNPHRWLPVPTFADVWAEFRGTNAIVIAVRPGSDAERAALTPGDRLLRIGALPLEQAIAERLTTAVDQRDSKSRAWALLSLVAGRADEARSLTVMDPADHRRTVTLPVERRFDREPGALSARLVGTNFGLIRCHNSLGQQTTVAAFDAALAQLRATRGLILDLRDVPSGGDSSVALGIMGRLVTTMLPYQRHRIPNYGQADVERNWIEQVAPRGPFTYTAPVVVLVNHWTGSMGEGMAIGLDTMHRARVIGTPMAHLAGAVSDFQLSQTGLRIAFATEQLYHVNGTARQDWVPPVVITDPATPDMDPILARGLAELKRMVKGLPNADEK